MGGFHERARYISKCFPVDGSHSCSMWVYLWCRCKGVVGGCVVLHWWGVTRCYHTDSLPLAKHEISPLSGHPLHSLDGMLEMSPTWEAPNGHHGSLGWWLQGSPPPKKKACLVIHLLVAELNMAIHHILNNCHLWLWYLESKEEEEEEWNRLNSISSHTFNLITWGIPISRFFSIFLKLSCLQNRS